MDKNKKIIFAIIGCVIIIAIIVTIVVIGGKSNSNPDLKIEKNLVDDNNMPGSKPQATQMNGVYTEAGKEVK